MDAQIKKNPEFLTFSKLLSILLLEKDFELYKEYLEYAENVVRLNHDLDYHWGWLYYVQSEYDKALQHLNKCDTSYKNRGIMLSDLLRYQIYLQRKDYNKAKFYWERHQEGIGQTGLFKQYKYERIIPTRVLLEWRADL